MREDTLPHIFLGKVNKYGDRVALREKEFGIWQEISWNEYCRCHACRTNCSVSPINASIA